MIRILFVCHGNICRSPMAEFIMKDIVKRSGREDAFFIASAATSSEELGNPVYPPARAELSAHRIPYERREAVRIRREDYGAYDLIIGMDDANVRNILRIFGGDPDGKVRKLLSYTGSDRDVADPWYNDRFDVAYDDIERGCRALFASLKP